MGLLSLMLTVLSSTAYADCGDTILSVSDGGKDISVHYHNNKYDWLKARCEKSGHDKHWTIHHRTGKRCALPRVDGCSLHGSGHLFSTRDKRLMTPSCNQHDLCYNSYGNDRIHCDNEFYKNLNDTRREFGGSFSAETVYSAVLVGGEKTFKKDQDWAKEHCR